MNREQLIASICTQYQVSAQQAEVVIAEGDCIVIACPGSGKTRTVGTRLAHQLKNWRSTRQGIAVISFTNVAAEEIADRLEALELPRTLPFPHFLGTINSFFDRFLFMPHAYRVMRPGLPPKKPQLVLPHNEDWVNKTFTDYKLKQKGIEICKFHYQANGDLVYRDIEKRITPSNSQTRIAKSCKIRMAKAGYATHTDAMYWTMILVKAFPGIAQSVSGQFAEVIIDEFQDTSAIQLEILQALFGRRIGNLMFVGDPNQSIYGFNEACPEVLLKPESAFTRTWSELSLTDNYRSSQAICNSTCQFRPRAEPDRALGEFREFDFNPICFSYPDRQVEQVVERFAGILDQNEIPSSEGVILSLKRSVVKKLLGIQKAQNFPSTIRMTIRKLARAAYLRDSQDWAGAEDLIEYVLLKIIFGEIDHLPFRQELGKLSYREWKYGMGFLLENLPSVELTLGDWLIAGRKVFNEFRETFPWPCEGLPSVGRLFPNIRSADKDYPMLEFIERIESDCPFDVKTIHQAKGETHTATMVVATPQPDKRSSPSDVLSWFIPDLDAGLRLEDVRCAFVAFTRARKVLVVAVPQSAWEDVRPKFLDSGFMIV